MHNLSPTAAERLARVLACARLVGASTELGTAARRLCAGARELVGARDVHCFFHDSTSGGLWSEIPPEISATVGPGVVGLAVHTREQQIVQRCGTDPRCWPGLDDRLASARERLLVQPICSARGEVHALLVLVREARALPFYAAEAATLAVLAESVGPALNNLGLALELDGQLHATQEGAPLFRAQAVTARRRTARWGDLIRVTPKWLPWAYRMLVALALAAAAYLVLGRVDVWSGGTAVVRLQDRTEVTAHRSGAMAEVYVQPGRVVERGELLARFADEDACEDLERLQRAFAAHLRRQLTDPSDAAAREDVARLRQELAEARAAVTEHEVRAPFSGTVSDVRIRSGQFMNAGEVLLSIATDEESRRVIAMLPGRDRPRLRAGMSMRLEFPGYPRNYQHVVVDSVGDEVIGPAEARRFLGPALSDAIELTGSVVVVEARLPDTEFAAGGDTFRFHDGMTAKAEIRLRRKTIVELLVPDLEGVFWHG